MFQYDIYRRLIQVTMKGLHIHNHGKTLLKVPPAISFWKLQLL